jgi:hypothetical protein
MHGVLRIGVMTSALKIESRWEGLTNPELDAAQIEGGEDGIREHASTRMKEKEGDEAWATVRVEGRDWGRVLGVGRLGGRVIAGMSQFLLFFFFWHSFICLFLGYPPQTGKKKTVGKENIRHIREGITPKSRLDSTTVNHLR